MVATNTCTNETDLYERFSSVTSLLRNGRLTNFSPLLPAVFNFRSTPFTLQNHFLFEPMFSRHLPKKLAIKAARQVGKSISQAVRSIVLCNSIPDFSVLHVAPLHDQISRFSMDYVRPFIEDSPLRGRWVNAKTESNILKRSFTNKSKMYFGYAKTSADRLRGIAVHMIGLDELQDLDLGLIPIIGETMSASQLGAGIRVDTGTPKTLDNAMEETWLSSSQAEWIIRCPACGKHNIPSLAHDLVRMIGPYHENIGEFKDGKTPAVVCASAQCGRPLEPRNGRWVHRFPQLRYASPGYHIPQILMPHHYANKQRWSALLAKQNGAENFTTAKFYNEVLGESYDIGARIVSRTDLIAAACLPISNNTKDPTEQIRYGQRYLFRVLGVDWGGGGEEQTSFTTAAVVGVLPDGRLDVIYGERLLTPHDPAAEAHRLLQLYQSFGCRYMAHDYNGAGNIREHIIVNAGIPISQVIPIVYNRTAKQNIMNFHQAEEGHSRNFWILDKARSLQLICELIKLQQIRFFKYDYVSADQKGVIEDFLALVEHKIPTARAGEIYSIFRARSASDDFAHSVNFAACSVWYHLQRWPNIAQLYKLKLTAEQCAALSGQVE